jgi:hypothetical protein
LLQKLNFLWIIFYTVHFYFITFIHFSNELKTYLILILFNIISCKAHNPDFPKL